MNVLNIGVLIYQCQKTIIFEARNAFFEKVRYVGVNFGKKCALQEFRKNHSYRARGLGMAELRLALRRNGQHGSRAVQEKKLILALRRKSYEARVLAFFVAKKSCLWHIDATEVYLGPKNSLNQICLPIFINLPENICETTKKKDSKLAKFEEKNHQKNSKN